ncbi:MAG: hypothetical protein WCB15_15200 [Desulfobacterales bacterium]|mgnify:CR=1 FL=1|jgi:hypothetical protein
MEEQIVFGDEMMPITLPDDVQSAPPGLSTTLSAVDDIVFVKYPVLACRQ